jgi:hypothetical protein
MAETAAASGRTTSEFQLSMIVTVAGFVLDAAGIVLHAIQESGAVTWHWLPGVLVVVGTLLSLLSALGYQRSRTMLKIAALQSDAARAIGVNVPLVRAVAEAVRPPPPPVVSPMVTPRSGP